MNPIHQIPEKRLVSSLRAAAVLRIPLDEFAEGWGILLETHEGNLGAQREAVLEADDGSRYMLVEHHDGPTNDVELRIDEGATDPGLVVDRFVKAVRLPSDAVVWRVADEDWDSNSGSVSWSEKANGTPSRSGRDRRTRNTRH